MLPYGVQVAVTDTLEGDRALLTAFRRGDRAALARVYRLYVQDVGLTLRRGVRVVVDGQIVRVGTGLPEADVEALVQETFVRAFQPAAREAFDGLRPFGAWVATIARNVAIDRARANKKDASTVSLHIVEEIGDDEVDPTWAIEAEELDTVVATTIAALPHRERELFRLRFVEGLQQRDVATALGLSVITIRRLDARLRATLLEALQAAGHLGGRRVGIPAHVRDRTKG